MQNILYYLKKYGKDGVLFLITLSCLGVLFYNNFKAENKKMEDVKSIALVNEEEKNSTEKESQQDELLYVDVKGAVKKPGVFAVNDGAIIKDVIDMAGGFLKTAYQNGINLSKKVSNEMVIYVYTKTEIKKYEESNNTPKNVVNETCKTSSYNICECTTNKESVIEIGESNQNDSNKVESKLVNINTASASELTALSGIGESKAQAIIKYREQNGNFKTIEDITNVNGIGDAVFDKIKDLITI